MTANRTRVLIEVTTAAVLMFALMLSVGAAGPIFERVTETARAR